ncbi:MAG: EAL domain-containing protein [Alishewanella sp.]|nr:EAL domain-containing protein [Alishewanella sp.]
MIKKILIVDDEPSILRSLNRLLFRAGYKVFSADNAKAALSVMQQEACQLLITDFRMPEMDGAALLAEVKLSYPSTVAMVLSGYTDFDSVLKLLNGGAAFRFLEKPWDEVELLAEVENAFKAYYERSNNIFVNSLMASSSDAIIEVFADGKIGRANGIAKQMFDLDYDPYSTLYELFSTTSAHELTDLIAKEKDHAVLKTSKDLDVEVFVKVFEPGALLLHLQIIEEAPPLFSSSINLPAVLDQRSIVRKADSLLERGEAFSMVAIKLKDYAFWSNIIGFSEVEALVDEISATFLEQAEGLSGTLGYLANEQFILIFENVASDLDVYERLTALLKPLTIEKFRKNGLGVEFVISYCLAPWDGNSGRELLSHVLVTNSLHVQGHSGFFMRYNAALIDRKREQLLLSEALSYAIENEQLYLHFQPQFDVCQQKIIGCEVLLRWQHSTFGDVSPAIFMPIAEHDGQIIEVGYWVIQRACLALAKWINQGVALNKVSINVSGKQLAQDDFISRVKAILANLKIDTALLEFELTESWIVENIEQSAEILSALKKVGFSIAIDDFGTGYSSLAYLSKLPIDTIKIARSLISPIVHDINTQSMIANIIRMAHDIKIQVVVEGVETLEQRHILEQLNCDVIQGSLIAQPQIEACFLKCLGIA